MGGTAQHRLSAGVRLNIKKQLYVTSNSHHRCADINEDIDNPCCTRGDTTVRLSYPAILSRPVNLRRQALRDRLYATGETYPWTASCVSVCGRRSHAATGRRHFQNWHPPRDYIRSDLHREWRYRTGLVCQFAPYTIHGLIPVARLIRIHHREASGHGVTGRWSHSHQSREEENSTESNQPRRQTGECKDSYIPLETS